MLRTSSDANSFTNFFLIFILSSNAFKISFNENICRLVMNYFPIVQNNLINGKFINELIEIQLN